MKILLGCLSFKEFTGSEMYVFEVAKGLIKQGYDVSVISANIGGELTNLANEANIKTYSFNNPPTYETFDIIHCQHVPVVNALIELYPNTKKICSIHSEVISLENPVKDKNIKKYIAIRPEIKKHINTKFGIPNEMIEVIYNPINEDKYNFGNTSVENAVIFVGTVDYLRKRSILDMVAYTKKHNMEFWLVGKNHSDYLDTILKEPHVKYHEACENVEDYVKRAKETAGVLLGRTTIEGWFCGKPGWIYKITEKGLIQTKRLHHPPKDLDDFRVNNVINKIINEYKNIVWEK
jgi:glycosyltransferase involved in cell wall biosynthesis